MSLCCSLQRKAWRAPYLSPGTRRWLGLEEEEGDESRPL